MFRKIKWYLKERKFEAVLFFIAVALFSIGLFKNSPKGEDSDSGLYLLSAIAVAIIGGCGRGAWHFFLGREKIIYEIEDPTFSAFQIESEKK